MARRTRILIGVLLVVALAALAFAFGSRVLDVYPTAEPRLGAVPEPPVPEPAPEPGAPQSPAPRDPTPVEPPDTPEPDDDTRYGWYYIADSSHDAPGVPAEASRLLTAYGGIYTGPDPGAVYLTVDQGYENGNTPAILDALARNGVKATFFVTRSYIVNNPGLVRRMVDEGHVVGNHTATHPSLPGIATDRATFAGELESTERAYEEVTGRSMAPIMRPPMGEYSARSLWLTQQLGYTSVFWGFAHRDWVVDDQPPVDVTISRILGGSHPGAIYLLHGVSSSDTQALDAAIEGLRAQGYDFGVL
ncbi:MAG: polysaccharide deacetylase family protein [Coriobacteriia bacterium]|nr:polysaccharide deacetylase family protein [Coriobacteriia bacterium]